MLITGGSGFLGASLSRHFREEFDVVIGSRNVKALRATAKASDVDFTPLDVSNADSVGEVFSRYKPRVVIHAAATKFVDVSEEHPFETVRANITGSENILRAAIDHDVNFTLGISTDKAAPPVANLYGMSKSVMERMFCSVGRYREGQFGTVRYGNVAWSTGSVFTIWDEMTRNKGHILSTGADLSRYFFSVDEAVNLIEFALKHRQDVAGQVLVRPLKGVTMHRILDIWASAYGVSWERIDARRGDRSEEYLIGVEEGADASVALLGGEEVVLIDPGSRKAQLNPTQLMSSRTAAQLSDEEIRQLIESKQEL